MDDGVAEDRQQRADRRELERIARRFRTLVDAAPDAILVVAADGRITAANPQAEQLLGYPLDELVGRSVDDLLPAELRHLHAGHRRAFLEEPTTRPMAAGRDLQARRRDGGLVPVDIALAAIVGDGVAEVAAFVRDATPRRQAEADRRRATVAELRRRQALEVNDKVVQGLVALLWNLGEGANEAARAIAEQTLRAARQMMRDLLRDDAESLRPGGLVRTTAARPEPPPTAPSRRDGVTILIADDEPDLRLLLTTRLMREPGVGRILQAMDGRQAVDLAIAERPEVVLLDLSMPHMDGLQAAEAIRAALPDVRLLVLSGYPADTMREAALAAGADEYLEKTLALDAIAASVLVPPALPV